MTTLKDDRIRLTVRLPADLHAQLQDRTGDSVLSMNAEIISLLRLGMSARIGKYKEFWNLTPLERISFLLEEVGTEITKEVS